MIYFIRSVDGIYTLSINLGWDKNLMTIMQTTSKSVSSTPVRRPLVFYVALHRSQAVLHDEIVSDAIGLEGIRIECG